jgi:hypothetical protein
MRMAVRRIQLEETAEEQRASGSADSSVLLRLHRLAAGLSHERLSEPARISSGGIGPWTRLSAHVGRSTLHGYRVKLILRWLIAVTSSLEVVDCREWMLSRSIKIGGPDRISDMFRARLCSRSCAAHKLNLKMRSVRRSRWWIQKNTLPEPTESVNPLSKIG